ENVGNDVAMAQVEGLSFIHSTNRKPGIVASENSAIESSELQTIFRNTRRVEPAAQPVRCFLAEEGNNPDPIEEVIDEFCVVFQLRRKLLGVPCNADFRGA